MRKTFAYFINLTIVGVIVTVNTMAQDTISFPLKIKIGLDVSGPALYMADKNILNTEGYVSMDLNEKTALVLGVGFSNYKHSQFNYEYLNRGAFMRAGADFNLMKPEKAQGKYWAGIGLRYGLSIFNSEVSSFYQDTYWGRVSSSIPRETNWGHFIEASPGVKAEVLGNLSIGWAVSLRMLIYSGTGKDLRPVSFPGYGNGAKSFSTGVNYFLVWHIPYKKITVITKKEEPPETDDTVKPPPRQTSGGISQ